MARSRSEKKRSAILDAAVDEIAECGLSAATSKIAHRAGVAAGTLFTYFATKNDLLNALYIELKLEFYNQMHQGFPHEAPLRDRARHLWLSFLDWSLDHPNRRKVSRLLNVSDIVTSETRRAATPPERTVVDTLIRELDQSPLLSGLPAGFAAATLSAMHDTAMDFILRAPERRTEIASQSFEIFWKAVQ